MQDCGEVLELADRHDLGSCVARREGSSPSFLTKRLLNETQEDIKLKIQTNINDEHQVEIAVELEQDLMEQHKRRAARKISRQTKLPGFRPGKAPYAVIVRNFGEEAVVEEALESIINEIYPKVIDEAGIEPYGPGSLTEVESKEPPKFKLLIPLMPEVELPDYKAIRKEYGFDSASDDEINQVLMNIQVQQAVTEPVEDRPVQSGDMVQLTITQTILNPDEGQEASIATDMPQSIYVNEDYDHEDSMPYQGFMKELIGMSLDEEKVVTHTYDEINEDNELSGKEVEFKFKVAAISSAELPELDDEFAQTVNPELETLDALKESIKEQVESYRKQQYENEYLTEVMDEIVENSTVKYPLDLFEAETKAYIDQMKEQVSRQGMEWETYLKANDQTEESILEEQEDEIKKRIQRILVLEEIAKLEELRVEQDELQAQVMQTMLQGGLMNYLNQLPKQQADQISQRITMDSANQILNDKLMHRLIDIASGKLDEVEAEEPVEEEAEAEISESQEETSEDSEDSAETEA